MLKPHHQGTPKAGLSSSPRLLNVTPHLLPSALGNGLANIQPGLTNKLAA